jgi:hypothetical protein
MQQVYLKAFSQSNLMIRGPEKPGLGQIPFTENYS